MSLIGQIASHKHYHISFNFSWRFFSLESRCLNKAVTSHLLSHPFYFYQLRYRSRCRPRSHHRPCAWSLLRWLGLRCRATTSIMESLTDAHISSKTLCTRPTTLRWTRSGYQCSAIYCMRETQAAARPDPFRTEDQTKGFGVERYLLFDIQC